MWWMAAAAALPTLLSQVNRPSAPSLPQINLPDREPWARELLTNAYRTDTTMMDLSRAKLMEDINAQLAARGMGGSSQGMSMQSGALANLMNQWIENQVARQAQAYGAVKGGDMGALQAQQTQNQQLMNQYQNQLAEHQGKWGSIQNLANIGLQAYGMNQAQTAAEAARQQAQANFDKYLGAIGRPAAVAPTGGYMVSPVSSAPSSYRSPYYGNIGG